MYGFVVEGLRASELRGAAVSRFRGFGVWMRGIKVLGFGVGSKPRVVAHRWIRHTLHLYPMF